MLLMLGSRDAIRPVVPDSLHVARPFELLLVGRDFACQIKCAVRLLNLYEEKSNKSEQKERASTSNREGASEQP